MSEEKTAALEVSHLAKSYREGTRSVPVLRDVSLRVARGETVIQNTVQQQLAEAPSLLSLSPRQLEILHSASCGFNTDDIAKQFGMTPDGVKKHFASICAKLGATTRSEAIAIAIRRQLLKI